MRNLKMKTKQNNKMTMVRRKTKKRTVNQTLCQSSFLSKIFWPFWFVLPHNLPVHFSNACFLFRTSPKFLMISTRRATVTPKREAVVVDEAVEEVVVVDEVVGGGVQEVEVLRRDLPKTRRVKKKQKMRMKTMTKMEKALPRMKIQKPKNQRPLPPLPPLLPAPHSILLWTL
jgi:hypothetical protein